jgi:thermitase
MKAFSADKAVIGSASIKALNSKHRVSRFRPFAKKERKFRKLRNGKTVELPDLSQIYLLEFPKDADVQSIADEYSRDPSVEYASPNYIRKLYVTTPNDPAYASDPDNDPNQWGLYKIWLGPLEAGNTGWQFTTGESTVKVAILDTGVNYDHEDLMTRVDSFEGHLYINNGSEGTDPMDDNGHGTHLAGIIGAATNNGTGVAGVDWSCRLIPIKIFDSTGHGYDYDIIKGLEWAVSKKADVINMSFGGPNDPALFDALSYAATSDCVLVAAAGNDNTSAKSYPAAYATRISQLISVAATGPDDKRASYSNYGTWVKVSAPGGEYRSGPIAFDNHDVLSTFPFNYESDSRIHIIGTPPNASYTYLAGTSMATPFVSGLAALVRAKFPALTADEVSQKIIDSADNIDAVNPVYAGKLGSGRINAFATLGGFYGSISYPASSTVAYGIITILGSATGEGFTDYSVVYGKGSNPSTWIPIVTSRTEPVLSGVLGTFDATGLDGNVTIRLTLNDLPSKVTKVTFQVGSPDPSILAGRPQYGPNPFNPKKENIMIMYTLTANADTYIYFFDIAGHQICRKWYPSGTQGGGSGTNRVYWDGKSDYGDTVANGVYLFRIFSDDRTIGKGKIVVLK